MTLHKTKYWGWVLNHSGYIPWRRSLTQTNFFKKKAPKSQILGFYELLSRLLKFMVETIILKAKYFDLQDLQERDFFWKRSLNFGVEYQNFGFKSKSLKKFWNKAAAIISNTFAGKLMKSHIFLSSRLKFKKKKSWGGEIKNPRGLGSGWNWIGHELMSWLSLKLRSFFPLYLCLLKKKFVVQILLLWLFSMEVGRPVRSLLKHLNLTQQCQPTVSKIKCKNF